MINRIKMRQQQRRTEREIYLHVVLQNLSVRLLKHLTEFLFKKQKKTSQSECRLYPKALSSKMKTCTGYADDFTCVISGETCREGRYSCCRN